MARRRHPLLIISKASVCLAIAACCVLHSFRSCAWVVGRTRQPCSQSRQLSSPIARCASTTATREEPSQWTVRELRQFLGSKGVRHNDCFEKQEMVDRAVDVLKSGASSAPAATPNAPAPAPPPPPPRAAPSEFGAFGELVTVPSVQAEEATLVFFHGFGDSARGFVSQLPTLLQLQSMRYVLPTAKSMGPMRSWFDSMAGPAVDSLAYAHHLLREELARGTSSERLFVGGFSQGGSVAVQAALSFPDARLGGCICASTFLGGSGSNLIVAQANQRLPVLVCHGDADPAVPLSSGTALAEALRARGVPSEMRTYSGMGHAYCPDEAADVSQFIKRRIIFAGGEKSLRQMSARQLKALLVEMGASTVGCFDKGDLLERARASLL